MAKKSTAKLITSVPTIATILVLLGIIGLAVAYKVKPKSVTPDSSPHGIEVIEGTNLYPQQNQAGSGSSLQNAVSDDAIAVEQSDDELQADSNQNIQSVTELDKLLENNELKVQ